MNGQLKVEDCHFDQMIEVNGQAVCKKSTFSNELLVRGEAILVECTFEKEIEVLNSKLTLENCKGVDLYITTPNKILSKSGAKVTFKGACSFNRIIFSSPGGKVYVSKESQVTIVENGQIIKVEDC